MPELQFVGDRAFLPGRPLVEFGNAAQDRVDRDGIGIGELSAGQIELPVPCEAGCIGERARAGRRLRRREERIPNHPGIDGATFEGCACVGRRQIGRLDLRIFHACVFQRANQEEVDVGALIERNLLALEIGQCFERQIFRDEDRFAFRCRWLVGGVDEGNARGLREDRWCFTGVPEINGAAAAKAKRARRRPLRLRKRRPGASRR